MKKLLLQISGYGIKSGVDPEIAEQTKLVNLVSLVGVPICVSYLFIFLFSQHLELVLFFGSGIIMFIFPLFLNKWFGLPVGRFFITIMAPVFFGILAILTGKEPGFYLGFIVLLITPIIVFPSVNKALPYLVVHVVIFACAVAGNIFIQPVSVIPFAMGIYLFNLLTVIFATITIVSIFKVALNQSRLEIVEKNKEIIDSITYAKRIQYTLLAHDSLLKENLNAHFVFFKPKDIVSGDFYWATKKDNKFYLAVCDCTGHGVPGAFMSLLNISFLNEAINEKHISEPHEILNHVRKQLIESISKEGGRDGMDAILFCFDGKKITYAAANNAPVLVSAGVLTLLPCDKMPVGKGENDSSFKLHHIQANQGDVVYLYTDGFADQFGGPNGKKFKYKTLNNLLLDNSNKSSVQQAAILEETLTKWKGDLEQIDDVCILGFSV